MDSWANPAKAEILSPDYIVYRGFSYVSGLFFALIYNKYSMNRKKYGIKKIILGILIIPSFLVFQMSWDGLHGQVNAATTASDIQDTQESIADLQSKLKKQEKAKAALEQNLGEIKSAVVLTQRDIAKVQGAINETDANIARKKQEIAELVNKIAMQKKVLSGLLQQIYYVKSKPLLNIVLAGHDFSKTFSLTDRYTTLEERVVLLSSQIEDSLQSLEWEQNNLADLKEQHRQALDFKIDKKQDLVADQIETQGDIADVQKTISRLKQELTQLQGDLVKLTGKSYDAKDIKDAVNFASQKTGVPAGFLIGVLKMETNLGANVGGCTYAEVEKGAEAAYKAKKLGKVAWNTFLNRRDTFKGICKELGIDYSSQKVSCNPKGYTGTGGAMGVAQFMPDTWNGYKAQVASITGHNPPSPWNLTDGVMAMALKLARTPGVTAGKTSAFKSAACSYLGTCYAPYINGILYWADNYKELLK